MSIRICLSVYLSVVGQSVVSLSQLHEASVMHDLHETCRYAAERRMLRARARAEGYAHKSDVQTGVVNVELRTEAESRGLSEELRAEGAVYKSERLIMRLRISCGECWAKSRRLRAKRSVAERLRLKRRSTVPRRKCRPREAKTAELASKSRQWD